VITSPDVTQALAEDIGVETAVLDPIEGQTDADADYLDVMYANLEALRAGLTCGG
jgi:zinc transport system substrate-binding protein